ncbi:MAG: DUF2244 domain-containing protein [Pseudomonadaceae bacterium]|nr:DUF2244 domain-containing protein [Pseudomonadaceae bacterium]
MISSEFDQSQRRGQVILQPNRSWSWRSNVVLLAGLSALSLTIATAFALQGAWLILPMTLLELTVVAGCIWYCVQKAYRQEVLTFSDAELVVETGHREVEKQYHFERFMTRFNITRPAHRGHRKRVMVSSRDMEIEIGEFLAEEEKDELVKTLRAMVQRLETVRQ